MPCVRLAKQVLSDTEWVWRHTSHKGSSRPYERPGVSKGLVEVQHRAGNKTCDCHAESGTATTDEALPSPSSPTSSSPSLEPSTSSSVRAHCWPRYGKREMDIWCTTVCKPRGPKARHRRRRALCRCPQIRTRECAQQSTLLSLLLTSSASLATHGTKEPPTNLTAN